MTDTNDIHEYDSGTAVASQTESDDDPETGVTSTSVVVQESKKHDVADEIGEWVDECRDLARRLGLDPYHVNYWVVDNDEMNELAAYNGFQHRYPHWRWGMAYDRQQKQNQYMGGKIFELVNNDNPAHAFLQVSNSITDQKAVVAHVEAHADFFANNEWFRDDPNAAQMLSQHADRIDEIMSRPDVDRSDVESLIDTLTCIEDNIDQTHTLLEADPMEVEERRLQQTDRAADVEQRIDDLNIDSSIKEQIFNDEWLDEHGDDGTPEFYGDVMAYLMRYGSAFDEETATSREFEDWEQEVIEMIRREAYYFAPQKMTKVLNEGHASYWETAMMAWENFADDNEFVEYADHHSMVLDSPGFNPYELGRSLLIHIEKQACRREVVDKLLRVDGISPSNFHEDVDFSAVVDMLDNPDAYSPAKRHFALARPANRGYLAKIDYDELQEQNRYIVDYDRYDSIGEAVRDVDYTAGWRRMREVRETHIDQTAIAEFLDEDFVRDSGYFVYDYNNHDGEHQVSQTDPQEVKRQFLLEFTNFGKPSIVVQDGNYNNSGELLLTHQYNGIPLDLGEAGEVMKRIAHDCWGKCVRLRTVDRSPDGSEVGIELFYYPGDVDLPAGHDSDKVNYEEIDLDEHDYLLAEGVDNYWTKPREWFE